jgi:hypothetical protein
VQNGVIAEFFLQSPNNFLEKFFALGGINCNYSFSPGAETFPPLRDSSAPTRPPLLCFGLLTGPLIAASRPSGNTRSRNTKLGTGISSPRRQARALFQKSRKTHHPSRPLPTKAAVRFWWPNSASCPIPAVDRRHLGWLRRVKTGDSPWISARNKQFVPAVPVPHCQTCHDATFACRRCSGSVVIMETVRACTMPGAKLPPSLGKLAAASRGLVRLVQNLDRDVRFREHPDKDSYPLTSTTRY